MGTQERAVIERARSELHYGACVCLIGGIAAVVLSPVSVDRAPAVFAGGVAALSLAPLLLSANNMRKGADGSAIAWACVALPVIFLSALLSLHFIHPSRLLGLVSCDAMANDCGLAPPISWLPVILFTACCILLTISIFVGRAASRRV
jgi:uncharacterized membrane protein